MGENRQPGEVCVALNLSVLPHVSRGRRSGSFEVRATSRGDATTTVVITYDVDDVQAWLASPTRTATFESAGFTVRPFVDPTVANQVALLAERRKRAPDAPPSWRRTAPSAVVSRTCGS